jgi:hypothetical protein
MATGPVAGVKTLRNQQFRTVLCAITLISAAHRFKVQFIG